MNVQDFVASLRKQHIDALLAEYAEVLERRPPEAMKDTEFRTLAQFWQSCDEPSRLLLRRLMRLASQNTMASVLAVLDNTSSEFEERFVLTATSSEGNVVGLSEGLLDTFWALEEEAGYANGAR